jgi:hypothetical protein
MSLNARLVLAAAILGVGLLARVGLRLHLDASGANTYPHLERPLEEFPEQLATAEDGNKVLWRGVNAANVERFKQDLPYKTDGLVYRVYATPEFPLPVQLYAVHSRAGEDRKHHPEICIRDVTGAPEDLAARQVIYLGGDEKRPVQRFQFETGTQQAITVYYWHYTFEPLGGQQQSFLQYLHQKLGTPAPSITVQISCHAPHERLQQIEELFLPAVDDLMRKEHLPSRSWMACNRLPIGLVRE